MNATRPISLALAFQLALTATMHLVAQARVYPLHYAVKNNASEAVVMGLLETRPNEAKRLDEVRGR